MAAAITRGCAPLVMPREAGASTRPLRAGGASSPPSPPLLGCGCQAWSATYATSTHGPTSTPRAAPLRNARRRAPSTPSPSAPGYAPPSPQGSSGMACLGYLRPRGGSRGGPSQSRRQPGSPSWVSCWGRMRLIPRPPRPPLHLASRPRSTHVKEQSWGQMGRAHPPLHTASRASSARVKEIELLESQEGIE